MLCCGDHVRSFVSDVASHECTLKEQLPVAPSACLTVPQSDLTSGLQKQHYCLRLRDCRVEMRQTIFAGSGAGRQVDIIEQWNHHVRCVLQPSARSASLKKGTQGTACIVLVRTLTVALGFFNILKFGFQRRDLDVRHLDETLNHVRMIVSETIMSRSSAVT